MLETNAILSDLPIGAKFYCNVSPNSEAHQVSGSLIVFCQVVGSRKGLTFCTLIDSELQRKWEEGPFLSKCLLLGKQCLTFNSIDRVQKVKEFTSLKEVFNPIEG